jgi:arabinose-5-phosphate isomerase
MDTLVTEKDMVSIGKNVFDMEIRELLRIKESLDKEFEKAVNTIYQSKGRVVVTGVGKSGIIGHKISASLSSTGTHSVYMNAAEGLHGDLGMINYNDIVLAISNSGSSAEVIQLLPSIQTIGAKIIALTGNENSPLGKAADIILNIGVEKEACPMNIAPTSSTTATLLMGDALTVALIEKRDFKPENFAVYHPGGALGRRLLTRVSDVMQPKENVAVGTKSDSLLTVVDKLTRKNLGVVCIEENNKVIGIITDGDIRRALNNNKDNFFNMNASDIMTNKFRFISSDRMAIEALDIMEQNERKISSIPVLNAGELIGLVRIHDVYDVK